MAKTKKYRRIFNPNLVKKNLSYSKQEISELFNVHPETVQNWYKEGLSRIDGKKPSLTFGDELYCFLKNRQKLRKTKCEFHELYCCKCKTSVSIKDSCLELEVLTSKRIRGKGRCVVCNTKVNKLFSTTKYDKITENFTLQRYIKNTY